MNCLRALFVVGFEGMNYTSACAICRDEITVQNVKDKWQSSELDVKVMNCRHAMHVSCFQEWQKQDLSGLCPVCRVVWIKKEDEIDYIPPLIYDYPPERYQELLVLTAICLIITGMAFGVVSLRS